MADRGARQGGCGCNKKKTTAQAQSTPAPKPAITPAQTNPARPT